MDWHGCETFRYTFLSRFEVPQLVLIVLLRLHVLSEVAVDGLEIQTHSHADTEGNIHQYLSEATNKNRYCHDSYLPTAHRYGMHTNAATPPDAHMHAYNAAYARTQALNHAWNDRWKFRWNVPCMSSQDMEWSNALHDYCRLIVNDCGGLLDTVETTNRPVGHRLGASTDYK